MKKIIAILTAVTMALFALTGCSSSTATNSANPSSTAVSSDGLEHGIQIPDDSGSSSAVVQTAGYSGGSMMDAQYKEYMGHCTKYISSNLSLTVTGKIESIRSPDPAGDIVFVLDISSDGKGNRAEVSWTMNDGNQQDTSRIFAYKKDDEITATGAFTGSTVEKPRIMAIVADTISAK